MYNMIIYIYIIVYNYTICFTFRGPATNREPRKELWWCAVVERKKQNKKCHCPIAL